MISKVARITGALFLLQLTLQCTSYDEGVSITVGLVHHPGGFDAPALADGEPRVFNTNLGYQVTLTEAWVSVTRVEVFPCGDLTARRGWLAPSVAYAHDPGPPTVADIDYVADLMVGDREVIALDVLRPAPGAYCGATVDLGPLPHGEIAGHTFVLRGTYVPLGGGEPVAFEMTSTAPLQTGITFDTADGAARVYRLSLDEPTAEIAVGLDYALWLDDIDFREPDQGQRLEAVQVNVIGSIHHHDPSLR